MKIHYVSGSRADFGLMKRCLLGISSSSLLELGVVLTGQHLSTHYGDTARDVWASGLSVVHEIPVELHGTDGVEMAHAMANELAELTNFWEIERPDLVLLLGDRGEMLAAALAAVHLGIHIAHIHGGERSGTLDESFRHAISKLAHYHFPATEDAAERLRCMGEIPDAITVIGAPGLVGLTDGVEADRYWLATYFDFPVSERFALVVFHPVVQEAHMVKVQIRILIETILSEGYVAIVARPNSDAGGLVIEEYLENLLNNKECRIRVVSHMERDIYLKVLASCNIIIGNSSSGIIESSSFGIPCINLGTRQNLRLRNNNTVDCPHILPAEIHAAIKSAVELPKPFTNIYGDGKTDKRLVGVLKRLELNSNQLKKYNAY